MARKRAFIVYECGEGWCVRECPIKEISWIQDPREVWAFSRLSQALWRIGKYIREQDTEKPGGQ